MSQLLYKDAKELGFAYDIQSDTQFLWIRFKDDEQRIAIPLKLSQMLSLQANLSSEIVQGYWG